MFVSGTYEASVPAGAVAPAWRGMHSRFRAYRASQPLLSPIVRFVFLTSTRGIEKVPRTGPIILAANHASNLDPILLVASLHRPLFCLGKHQLFDNRFGSLLLDTLGGQIRVDREAGGNERAVGAALQVLERGEALGLFPEGTRTLNRRLQPGRTGVALLAFLSGAPVFPVAIRGTFEAFPPGRSVPRIFSRTSVTVGDPLHVPREPDAVSSSRRCRELADDVMTAIAGLLGVTYQRSRVTRPAAMW